jgi:hypothetical protein
VARLADDRPPLILRGHVRLSPHPGDPQGREYIEGLAAGVDRLAPEAGESLAAQLARVRVACGPVAGVRYAVGDRRTRPGDPLADAGGAHRGDLNALFAAHQGPQPGTWRVTSEIRVGGPAGFDLAAALAPHAGKFVHLEIDF